MGRQARGVRAMDLAKGDFLVAAEVVEENGLMLSIAENGYGKRTPLKHYRLTRRGGKGVINMKVTPRTGKVVGVLAVADETDVMIITQDGKLIRIEAAAIRQSGRSAQGVRLVKMETSDRVAAACVVTEDEALTQARLWLVAAAKQTIANVLDVLGVTAPESMERTDG